MKDTLPKVTPTPSSSCTYCIKVIDGKGQE